MKIWFPTIKADSGSDVYTNRLAESLRSYGVETIITQLPKYYEFAPFLLRNFKPPIGTDIIHANSWIAFAFTGSDIPVVATVHLPVLGPTYSKYKTLPQMIYHELLIKRYEKSSLCLANRITMVSSFVKNSIISSYGDLESTVIYNCVDTRFFTPADKAKYSSDRPFQLLFVGNLTRRKGVDLLGPIMNKLGKNFVLSATTGLREHSFELKANNIYNIGKLAGKQLVSTYQEADALLFPTRLEGFGYAALESMACGTPVITSNNSSLPEVVQHGETGILCPTDDIDAFVSACRYLRNTPNILESFGKAARNRAVTLFSESHILDKYLNMYTDLLSN